MAAPDKKPVTMEELLVSSLAQTDALAKLLIEKRLITREEFIQKISEERAQGGRFRLPRGGPRRGDFVETSPLKPLFSNAFFSRACVADMGVFH